MNPPPENPEGYPGGSPFPPGKEPKLAGVIKLLVAAGVDIDWTQVSITPIDPNISQPIQVDCDGCEFAIIGPAAELQVQVVPPGAQYHGIGSTIRLQGTATLEIRLHQHQYDEKFAWPKVKVMYYRKNKVVGITSWSPP